MELIMPLKEGSLKTLVYKDSDMDKSNISQMLLHQMFQALHCVARHNIIHRDVKPDNILYEIAYTEEGQPYYHFTLADFGLSNDAAEARTYAGTEPFMAPEISVMKGSMQTVKVDIWSLFATLIWFWDTAGFRNSCTDGRDVHQWLVDISKRPLFRRVRNMARINPVERPSAEELLNSEAYLPVVEDTSSILEEEDDEGLSALHPDDDPGAKFAAGTYHNQSYSSKELVRSVEYEGAYRLNRDKNKGSATHSMSRAQPQGLQEGYRESYGSGQVSELFF
jgi:serine/threonine protein kinase